MNIKKYFTIKNIIGVGIIIGLIITLFSVDSCRRNQLSANRATIDSMTLANQELVKTVNKQGDTIVKQQVIITDDQEALKKLALDVFDLKKSEEKRIKQIDALIRIKSSTRIDSVEVAYVDKEERKRFSDSVEKACADVIAYYDTNYIKVPKQVSIDSNQNKDFQFGGTVKKDKFVIDSVIFPNKQDIIVVETGGWFKRDINKKFHIFQKRKMEIFVKNSNKYVHVNGMNSIIYKPKPKARWLERLGLFGVGVAATALILK